MLKYKCPHCGEPTISPLKKAFAGNQKSKGVACPNCGGRCTNGMQSAVFHTIIDIIMLAIVLVAYVKMDVSTWVIIAALLGAAVINRIFDALFFPLDKSLRID